MTPHSLGRAFCEATHTVAMSKGSRVFARSSTWNGLSCAFYTQIHKRGDSERKFCECTAKRKEQERARMHMGLSTASINGFEERGLVL